MCRKQWLAGLLAAFMLISMAPMALATEEDVLTRGEARDMLSAAASDYQPGVTGADILLGDENGEIHEDRGLTRAEALVMLQRAFGELPTPVGANARNAYPAGSFTDVPNWAAQELENVFAAGIVAGTSDTTFSPHEPVTEEQLDLFIRRVYALEGSNLKDDFYATVNKDWLDNSVIQTGRAVSGTLYDVMYKVNDDVAVLIREIATAKHEQGTGEQKIADLYHNILDWDARNRAGIAPIAPYLTAVDEANSLDELLTVQSQISEELGSILLLGFGLTIDLKDSTKYTEIFGTFSPSMTKDFYENGTEAQTTAYLTYLTTMLTLGGVEETEAAAQAQSTYELEKTLAAAMLSPQDQLNVDKIYNLYSMEELQKLFPNVDLTAIYTQSGLKPVDTVGVTDVGLLEAAAQLFDESHLEELKTMTRLGLLIGYGTALNREFLDASNAFNQAYMGMQGSQTDEELAAVQVQNLMSDYLGQAYVKEYFSAEAKADVEDMIADFKDIYKDRIQTLDWMSDETKAMAVRKLDAIGVKVGYPDQWPSDMDQVEIKSVADGGSFFANLVAISKANHEKLLTYQGSTVDKSEWITPAFTVNAFYNASSNDITFPAGILQAPLYDVSASREQNLGGIGYVIAHEITHAFDNNGAKFDENGNAADWWTAEDYAAFQALCDQAIAYYDGVESAPGITCNGAQTLSENVADLGAAACITEAASREESPDYETLYRAMAQTWRFTASREYQQSIAQMDVHAQDKLRGSLVLQSLDQFYETFDIQPGDGMWIDPADRVSIW